MNQVTRRIRPLAWFASFAIAAGAADVPPLSGDLFVHDPSRIVQDGTNFFLFSTGMGIATKSSLDLRLWSRGRPVFNAPPEWTTNAVPGFRGHFWAPDVIRLGERFHVYYSVSTFGKQRSAIGLVTNPTLDANSPEYRWIDEGPVIESNPGDPFNAIDPSVMRDRDGRLWMAFGSFWQGIFLFELDPRTGKRIATKSPLHRIAYHPAIEAAGLHRRDDHYYLFINWGTCCRGTNSTYEVRVGRSKRVTGPYVDRDGKDLAERGGSPFLATNGSEIGPGHVEVWRRAGKDYIGFHVYDATQRGRSQLRIRELRWTDDGWPDPIE